MTLDSCVIFGGTGFLGRHLTDYLFKYKIAKRVYWADLKPLDPLNIFANSHQYLEEGRAIFVKCDVKDSISLYEMEGSVDLIINLAAVHREPGHEACEYFETNLLGAENVCKWAEEQECNKIIFSSSIAPYGPSEDKKTELSIPVPETPYGSSKLVAENIHRIWQAKEAIDRRLVIIRPGVIFGPGEGGNVSRLVKAVLGRYFVFVGNESTVKAGVYVKELCKALFWVVEKQNGFKENVSLFNMTMNPAPNLKEYTDTICEVAEVNRTILRVPYHLLYILSVIIQGLSSLFGITQPLNPVRVRKLIRSTNIEATYLQKRGYQYQYTLKEAFRDWKSIQGDEWL